MYFDSKCVVILFDFYPMLFADCGNCKQYDYFRNADLKKKVSEYHLLENIE